MLKRLIQLSIDHAFLVIAMAMILVGFAVYQVPRMSWDVFPELNAPTVVVLTEAPGYAADEVEQNVTFPIESSVNGLPGVRRVRSGSAIGLSIVWVEFDWGADIYQARYLVNERVSAIEDNLPEGVHWGMTPIGSITGEIMLMSLSSANDAQGNPLISELELRSYAEFELRNLLLSVPGVSQVVAIGGQLPEYQVNVDPAMLRLFDMTISDVIAAAGKTHSTAGGGYLPHVEGLEIPLRQTARVRSEKDISSTLIKHHQGAPITIGQVAQVVRGGAPRRGAGSEAGNPAVVISIQKSPATNTLAITKAIDAKLDQLEPSLPKGIKLNRHVMRQSDFINLSVNNVLIVSRDAAIFVAIVLILFLMNARTTIISLVAIPVSMAIALLMAWLWGGSINVMTLGGLAVAIGEVVDDAIIDVENVFRRLKENAALPIEQRKPHVQVIYDASNEIRSSVVFATIIIVIVFVPLLFLQGLEGRFFRPLGLMYITSILASLLVALTLTPAMCRFMLAKVSKAKADPSSTATTTGAAPAAAKSSTSHDGALVRLLKRLYEPTLEIVLRFRRTVMALAAIATAASLWLASTFGTSFLPEFNEGTFTVFLMAPPGTSLIESDRLARGVESRLTEIEGVRAVVRRTGRAERDEHAEPVSSSEIEVTVKPDFDKQQVRAAIDQVLGTVPGITTMIGQPIEHRLSHVLSGTPAAIAINVFGEDLGKLRIIAKEIEGQLKSLPGARDVSANREVMIVTLPIRYRHDDLARWGLTPAGAAEQVKQAIFGQTVAQVNEGVRRHDIVVRLAEEDRQSIEQVRGLLLRGETGAIVRLDEVADIGREMASNLIARENARRKAVISCNVADGHNLGQLITQVQSLADPIVQGHGYTVEYGGQFEAQQSAARTILIMGSGVLLVILLLLNFALGSARAAALVMLNLPLALIGGIAAIFITESPDVFNNAMALFGIGQRYQPPVISIASMVGFVTLFGIAVRNGILLVNHYHHLLEHDKLPLRQAIIQGSMERLSPILMTAISAVLGLLPLALAAGRPGSELLAPLAIVVLGGLITSTFLNLIVVPAGYAWVFGATHTKENTSLAKAGG